MKITKKLLTLALAAMLLLSLAVPAMAADSDFAIEDGVLYKYYGPGGDVVIPDGVTKIATYSFLFCTTLTSVTIPEGVTEISFDAFNGCTSMTSAIIPASVTSVGSLAFCCPNLTDVYFGGTQEQWESFDKANLDAGWESTIFDIFTPTMHYNSTGPDASTAPSQPEPAPSGNAMPTNDQLTVNGELQSPTVYKIDGSNYFKIRDLAAMLSGSEKQFDVGYDGELKSVTLTTGKGYAKLDTDLAGAATGGNQTATPSNDSIYIDGQKIDVTVYKIGGSNYFKLRDLGRALDFYVGWTAADGVFIDTSKPYSD